MLKLNDVTWLYQHLPMRFTLDVARGERIAVLGPSGAGKSTLLNLIAGFLPPASGSLLINGEVHNATPPAQRPVSMLFQENNLFNHLTIRQNISLGIHPGLKLNREQQAQVTAIAGQMGIDALLERLPGELSGGQRQRAALARCLVRQQPVLLLDEPFSALEFHIGLNISVSHINAPTFIDDCLHYQRGFEGKAVKLMLEITEQEPLLLNGAVVDKLNTLHSRGFSIALDDFGTGYSGLSCLHELIFDYIKIDQSFVGRVTGEAPASKLLDCVIEMARTLSLRIIAEGVETEAQRDYLNRQNIHLLQGYYFWKPMPYVALVMLLLSKPKARIVEE